MRRALVWIWGVLLALGAAAPPTKVEVSAAGKMLNRVEVRDTELK